jgi:hypothetical protein
MNRDRAIGGKAHGLMTAHRIYRASPGHGDDPDKSLLQQTHGLLEDRGQVVCVCRRHMCIVLVDLVATDDRGTTATPSVSYVTTFLYGRWTSPIRRVWGRKIFFHHPRLLRATRFLECRPSSIQTKKAIAVASVVVR